MLQIIPYLLMWLGLWSCYFSLANLNPFLHPSTKGLSPMVDQADGFLTLSSNIFLLGLPSWKIWFALTGALALALAIFILTKNKRKQAEHERALLKKLRKAERVALRSKMNPHFIFNVLNSIQGFIVDGDRVASASYLAKFSKLVRMALEHSEMGKITLEEELLFLNGYLELERLRFKHHFDFEINVHPSIDTTKRFISPMLLQPFVENAILHGLAPTKHQGRLQISIGQKEGQLAVRIFDNGIGISESKKRKRANRHVPLGMDITSQRLNLLSRRKAKTSKEVNELVDAEGSVVGTEVVLWI